MREFFGDEIALDAVRQKVAAQIVSLTGVHDVAKVKLNGTEANVALDSEPAQVAELGTVTLTEGDV